MSSLIGDIVANARALEVHSRAVQTAGQNLANVNNPHYARQQQLVKSGEVVNTGSGVSSIGIDSEGLRHVRDAFLDKHVVKETSLRTALESQHRVAAWVEDSLGEQVDRSGDSGVLDGARGDNTSQSGVSQALDDFFNAFHEFAASPVESSARRDLVQRGESLVSQLKNIDSRLNTISDSISEEINMKTTEGNNLLEKISSLNERIRRLEIGSSNDAVNLRDERQAALEELAGIIDFTTDFDENSNLLINVVDDAGSEVTLVNGNNVSNKLAFDGSAVALAGAGTVLNVQGGSLAGLIDAQDTTVSRVKGDIDALAAELVNSVNAAYNPTGATGNFFDATGLTAATITLDGSLSADSLKASDSGNSGANDIALAVAELSDKTFSIASGDSLNGTYGGFYGGVVSGVGQDVADLEDKLENQKLVEDAFRAQRDSVSGVNVDEEVTDLVRFQRSFQATARVINTLDSMLELVVSGLGR